MKGSEKQVKWAEDILSQTRDFIAAQIAHATKYFPEDVHLWEKASQSWEHIVSNVSDASEIINNRNSLGKSGVIRVVDQLRTLKSNGIVIDDIPNA